MDLTFEFVSEFRGFILKDMKDVLEICGAAVFAIAVAC